MSNELFIDCFTGLPVKKEDIKFWRGVNSFDYCYKLDAIGEVYMSWEAFETIKEENFKSAREIIAGILRNLWELNEKFTFSRDGRTFDFIDEDFITSKIYEEQFDYPKTFKDKAFSFLKLIYQKGGNDFETFKFQSHKDFTLTYGSENEFKKIIDFLEEENLIKLDKISTKDTVFYEVRMTSKSIKEIENKESNNILQILHETLSKDEIDLAVILFKDSSTDAAVKVELIQISGRLSYLDKCNRLGTISLEDYTRHRNQIRLNLLEIIEKYNVKI